MWKPSKLTIEQQEERRVEAGRLLLAGELTQAEIARRLGVTPRTVSEWAKRMRHGNLGLDALKSRPTVRSPAPPDAPALGRGPRGPRARGHRRGIPDRAVDARPGPRADPEAMGRGLPRPLPLRGAEVLGMESADSGSSGQGAGRGIGPGLVGEGLAPDQKKARRQGAEIVCVVETGFSFRDGVATTRAPQGRTPVLRRVRKRRVLSTAIGPTLSGRIYKRHLDRAIRGPDAVEFLKHLRRQVGGPMIVIWDRLRARRSKKVKAYAAEHRDRIIEWLPPSAPDLNREEGCHGNVKQGLKNARPESVEEIRRHADRGLARLRHRPDLILGFFHHAGYRLRRLT